MLSAGSYPITMFGALELPPILPAKPELYGALRETHTIMAYLLFLTFLAHLGAVLFHTLVLRDGLLRRMIPWTIRPEAKESRPVGSTVGIDG
jgi:cytochrome b561